MTQAQKIADAYAEFHANLPKIVAYLKKQNVIKEK